ncbi:MAG: SPOR domain-containing protein, partial [Rhizobiales bacterium]|nr:SPOR domain-containing protein [Rhizobacter sp.]
EPSPVTPGNDGARARALLEGKPAVVVAAADAGRFVVQVGAFADASAARETRLKVEKLGLKTYTQVASTAAGERIRVRVGPFGTRDEADKAMARAKGAGLNAVVLTL